MLLEAYKQNPLEMDSWLEQIAEEDAALQKQEDQNRIAAEQAKIKEQEEELHRQEKERVDRCMKVYESLPQETQNELWLMAEKIESRSLPKGLKPFKPVIHQRIIRLMQEERYLNEEEL